MIVANLRALILIVEEPGSLTPFSKPLLQLDRIRSRATHQPTEFAGLRLSSDRLRVQEDGNNRLFQFATLTQGLEFGLSLSD